MKGTKITLSSIKSLPVSPPSATKIVQWDAEIRGFGAYRPGNGTVSFVFQYAMPEGKTKSLMFGRLGELTIGQARLIAAEMAFERCRGLDPIAERKAAMRAIAAAEAVVIRSYALDFLERRRSEDKPFNKAQEAIIMRDVVGLLGDERMDRLTIGKVEGFAADLAKRGPSARRMGLVYLNIILNDAVRREIIDRNVAKKVAINKAGARERRLRDDELQRFIEATTDLGGCRGDIYEVLVRTLKRKEEISRMKWSELNVPKQEWHLGAARTKGRASHLIELPRQVMDIILRQQPDPRLRVGPVFSMDGGKTSPEMGSQVKDLVDAHLHKRLEAANRRDGTPTAFAHYTIHDLRTTGASRLQEKPFQLNAMLIDAILLHKDSNEVTRTYQRAKLEIEAGEALQRWNDFIDDLMADPSAWPGGRERMPIVDGEERKQRIGELRAEWPLRADQKRAAERKAKNGS